MRFPQQPHLRRPFIDAHDAIFVRELQEEGFNCMCLNSKGQVAGDTHFAAAYLLKSRQWMYDRATRVFLSMMANGRYVERTEAELRLESDGMMKHMAQHADARSLLINATPERLVEILKEMVGAE